MIAFFIGLGVAGFALVVVFLAKLSSLEPGLRNAVLGVRIILAICLILGIWWWNGKQKSSGRTFFGDLKFDKQMLIGEWRTDYLYDKENDIVLPSFYSFYPDSTFYYNVDHVEGKWIYKDEEERLYLFKSLGKTQEIQLKRFDGFVLEIEDINDGSTRKLFKEKNVPHGREDAKKYEAEHPN